MNTEVDANLIIGMVIITTVTLGVLSIFTWITTHEYNDSFIEYLTEPFTRKKPKDEPSPTI